MKSAAIRLFIKPHCPWCHKAIAWLKARGVAHETLDVTANPEYRAQMFTLSGQSLAPVIEVNGRVLADFGPEELEQWWREQGLPG